ncbi:MAG: TIGR04283 family arsenosugar biosynthesis glycosyltransferase [Pseudomonadota bacterium]|nr:TIGR04283 family arsenosugar biosynthesis glycosyltransferase [Pseudomonadota bacterium]
MIPPLSVIIPALNEEKALPRTLERLFAQDGGFEVILVDGGSGDRTRAIAETCPGVRVITAPRGRAAQMNAGAARAQGDWLLFLHADTLLPAGALAAIQGLDEAVLAGGFRHRFSGSGFSLRLISFMHNLRCRSTRVIYGDQAFFIRRRLFESLGGFPNQPILEDVAFCETLVKMTRPVLLDLTVVTDARKFIRNGVWRSLYQVAVILTCVELRRPIPAAAMKFFQDVR